MDIVVRNVEILTMNGVTPDLFKGTVGISGNRISVVDRGDGSIESFIIASGGSLREIDGRGKLLMPGLINTHGHLSMSLLRGCGDDTPLMEWLNNIVWPIEAKFIDKDYTIGADLSIAEMLLGGTTSCVDMYWKQSLVCESADRLGIRLLLGVTIIGDEMLEGVLEEFDQLCDKFSSHEHISVSIAPHALYTCSERVLREVTTAARRRGCLIQIHVSETLDEINIIKERYGCSPIELLDRWGVLGSDFILAHAVHLSDSDIEILVHSGASTVYNPQCNMKLSSGVSPVYKLLNAGVNVAFGTDGACSNNDLDMWEEMRTGSYLQKLNSGDVCAIDAYEALRMATVGGAKALGMEEQLGVIVEGALADVILIDMVKPHLYPSSNTVANLAYCGKASDVDTVIVNGRLVVENRKLLTGDLSSIFKSANESRNRLVKNTI